MSSLFLALGRRRFACVLFGIGAVAVGACSGTGTGSGAVPSSVGDLARNLVIRLSGSQPVYTFSPVDIGTNTQITGVDNGNSKTGYDIVGVYYGAQKQYTSFTAPSPYPSSKAGVTVIPSPPGDPYPVFLAGRNNGNTGVGWGQGFGSAKCAICGYIYDSKGKSWTGPLWDQNEGTGNCAKTYLTGINNSFVAVGYYLVNSGSTCTTQAFEEYSYPSGLQFVDLHPTASDESTPLDSTANGINNKGDVVGSLTPKSGIPVAWEYHELIYATLPIPPASSSVQALGINWQGSVVGSYTASGKTHGFLLSKGNLDAPLDDLPYGLTVLSSIDDTSHISGWTQDASQNLDGFVACPSPCP
jgi:hypothetical protein